MDLILDAKQLAEKYKLTNEDISPVKKSFDKPNVEFEVYLFVNYDICNFTKYKSENINWINLLNYFVSTVSNPRPDWTMKFWKFSGDSLTYTKKIQSIDEICKAIKSSYAQLKYLQNYLNLEIKPRKKIYIKGCIWISSFSTNEDYITNNMKFTKSKFGEEFVGENIDEGFRLCSCSKAGNLVIDPKIVYILNLYYIALNNASKDDNNSNDIPNGYLHSELQNKMYQTLYDKIKNSIITIQHKYIIESEIKKFYLMEFKKFKGVWNERDYPIFWYIDDIQTNEFIYDEVVNKKTLREHKLYSSSNKEIINYYTKKRDELATIITQVELDSLINEIIEYLKIFPNDNISGELIYDQANLYYTVACVLVENNIDLGILIFKRTEHRKHLRNVWDLVSVKHSRISVINNYKGLIDYIQKMVKKNLNLNDSLGSLSIVEDKKRNSIIPISLCNIFRNGEVHNGILCVAEINLKNCTPEEYITSLSSAIKKGKLYCDVKLVKYDNCKCEYNSKYDYIHLDDIIIRSLNPDEVLNDSSSVCNNPNYDSKFNKIQNEDAFGITYLPYSIKQILKNRKEGKKQEPIERTDENES